MPTVHQKWRHIEESKHELSSAVRSTIWWLKPEGVWKHQRHSRTRTNKKNNSIEKLQRQKHITYKKKPLSNKFLVREGLQKRASSPTRVKNAGGAAPERETTPIQFFFTFLNILFHIDYRSECTFWNKVRYKSRSKLEDSKIKDKNELPLFTSFHCSGSPSSPLSVFQFGFKLASIPFLLLCTRESELLPFVSSRFWILFFVSCLLETRYESNLESVMNGSCYIDFDLNMCDLWNLLLFMAYLWCEIRPCGYICGFGFSFMVLWLLLDFFLRMNVHEVFMMYS